MNRFVLAILLLIVVAAVLVYFWGKNIRSNFNALIPRVSPVASSMLYASPSGSYSAQPIGSELPGTGL